MREGSGSPVETPEWRVDTCTGRQPPRPVAATPRRLAARVAAAAATPAAPAARWLGRPSQKGCFLKSSS